MQNDGKIDLWPFVHLGLILPTQRRVEFGAEDANQVSISSTFYEHLLRAQIPKA